MTNTYDRFNSWKALLHSDKLMECSKGGLPTPVNWHTYISNICPYSCNFCIMEGKRVEGAMLPSATLKKIARDASELEVKLIHISGGGEPLTHPDVNEYITEIKKYGTKIAMSTNGYFLNRLNENIDHLRISFNAGKGETYEKIHGKKKSFDRVLKNIQNAIEQEKGKDIGLGYVLTPENWREVDSFVRIAEDLGVNFVHIRPAYWPEKNNEIVAAVKGISPSSKKIDVFSVSDKFSGYWDGDRDPCRATPIHAVTAATGEFLLCQDRLDLRWGDYNTQTFKDIWFSQDHLDLIKKAQACNIRCVESGANKLIEEFFVKDSVRRDLL